MKNFVLVFYIWFGLGLAAGLADDDTTVMGFIFAGILWPLMLGMYVGKAMRVIKLMPNG